MSFFTQDPKTIKLLKEYFSNSAQDGKDVSSPTTIINSPGEIGSTSPESERAPSGNLQGD